MKQANQMNKVNKLSANKATLILLRGVPGSGKSTTAKLLSSMFEIAYIEADHYFIDDEGNYNFNPAELGKAHEYCQYNCRVALSSGSDIIVSNTSTTEKEVQTYKDIAKECGANFISLIVENRHGGESIHNVPPEKIQQMKDRFSIKL